MTAQAKSTLWEIVRNLAVYGIVLIGTTYVLASRTADKVQSNREEARKELADAVAIRRAEQAVLETRMHMYEANQKELMDALRRLTDAVAAGNRDSGAFREDTIRGLSVLGEQVKGLRSDFNDFRSQRKP